MRAILRALLLIGGCAPSLDDFTVADGGLDAAIDGDAIEGDASDDAAGDASDDADALTDAMTDGDAEVPTHSADLLCATEWSALLGCEGRRVERGIGDVVDVDGLAIARTTDHTVIAYQDTQFFDQADLVLADFADEAIEPRITTIVGTLGEVLGRSIALTELRGTFHLAYWSRSDFNGSVLYRTYRDGTLSESIVITGMVGSEGEVAIGVDGEGDADVVFHDDTSGAYASRRSVDDTLGPTRMFATDPTPSPGAVAIARDEAGTTHVALRLGATLTVGQPRYARGDRDGFTLARTLDNETLSRQSGLGIAIALEGETHHVAYLDWDDGIAEVRVASFEAPDGVIRIETVLSGLVIPERPTRHSLAMVVDDRSYVHVVACAPRESGVQIAYLRRNASGMWFRETIDVSSGDLAACRVAIVAKPGGYFEVAYFDPGLGVINRAELVPLEAR